MDTMAYIGRKPASYEKPKRFPRNSTEFMLTMTQSCECGGRKLTFLRRSADRSGTLYVWCPLCQTQEFETEILIMKKRLCELEEAEDKRHRLREFGIKT